MDNALELVAKYGYLVVFILVFLDQAMVSVPSPPFVTAMGVLSAAGRFNPGFALTVILSAASLADALWYVVGRSRWTRAFDRFVIKIPGTKVARLSSILKKGMLGGCLTVKFSLLPSSLVPFFAGSTRFPVSRFVVFGSIANCAWASVFFLGGFASARGAGAWLGYDNKPTAIICTICVIALALPLGKALLGSSSQGERSSS